MSGKALFLGRMRALLTDAWSLVILLIIIIISCYASVISDSAKTAPATVAIVNNDKGQCSEKLIKMLQEDENYKFYVVSYDEAVRMTAWSEAHSVFIISEDFTEKVRRREYDNLISEIVMQDSMDINSVREIIINSVIKVWIEELAGNNLEGLTDASEEEMQEFYDQAGQIWQGDTVLRVQEHSVSRSREIEEKKKDIPGLRWYAALALMYLLLGGTWMMEYGRNGLMSRIKQNGYSVARVFFWQSLPGMIMVSIGYVIVAMFCLGTSGLMYLPAFIIYLIGIFGIAFIVCIICRRFSTLLMVAPVVGLILSTVSGLLAKLPEWADIWNIISVVFPGHWFSEMISLGETASNIVIGIVVSVLWIVTGLLVQGFISHIRK